ncbi:hypothetical protein [Neobacillus sp.]|uniref:hypothetical protein n=1 Tax=Neobacillus sp. TaxID=2675273 RepID=UPI0035B52FF9
MKLIYYVEMMDKNNPDGWTNKVDLYGYEKMVLIMAYGYSKSFHTENEYRTISLIDDTVKKLESADFVLINKEEKFVLTEV